MNKQLKVWGKIDLKGQVTHFANQVFCAALEQFYILI